LASKAVLSGFNVVLRWVCARWLLNRMTLLHRYDLTSQTGNSLQLPIATVHTGDSVQHGLSAAGGDMAVMLMIVEAT
jgi:hypothetical protein